jgi:broad specificity phosphatase PhoE
VEGHGALHGHVDVGLTAEGVRQLERVAERLADEPLAAVYSSDLQRARVGAEIVARGRAILPVADRDFRELDMGRWDGRPFREVWEAERELLEAWWGDLEGFVVPGGESLGQLRRRVLRALERVLTQHAGGTVCLVAHGGVNRVILLNLLGAPVARFLSLAQDYGCLNLVEYFADGNAVVRLVNG